MKTIDWNGLTPAVWAIAEANGVDVGVGANMVQQNLREEAAVNPGAEELPEAFRPEWDANEAFNAWLRTIRANYGALCELRRAEDWAGMVALMGAAQDPGPIDGQRPWEESHAQ